jgi:hypothetical protein
MDAVQTANPPTFESVWAALMENREQVKELAENQKETDRQMKETDRQLGKLGSRFGEVVEYMVAPNLREKFRELGYDFPKTNQSTYVNDIDNKISFEIDIMLENGDKAMLVEVKTKPSAEDVQDHIKRIEKMRKYADLHDDRRTFLGAVAAAVMTKNVKEYTLKQGLFVIEPAGETFSIIPPDNNPKEW